MIPPLSSIRGLLFGEGPGSGLLLRLRSDEAATALQENFLWFSSSDGLNVLEHRLHWTIWLEEAADDETTVLAAFGTGTGVRVTAAVVLGSA